WAVVVHDNHFVFHALDRIEHRHQLLNDRSDVFSFVVRWENERYVHDGIAGGWRNDKAPRRTCLQRECVEHMPLDPRLTHWVSRALVMIFFVAHPNACTTGTPWAGRR